MSSFLSSSVDNEKEQSLHKLNIKHLPSGIYILVLYTLDDMKIIKITHN